MQTAPEIAVSKGGVLFVHPKDARVPAGIANEPADGNRVPGSVSDPDLQTRYEKQKLQRQRRIVSP